MTVFMAKGLLQISLSLLISSLGDNQKGDYPGLAWFWQLRTLKESRSNSTDYPTGFKGVN